MSLGDGDNIPITDIVVNNYVPWLNDMVGTQLRSIGVNSFPIFSDSYIVSNGQPKISNESFFMIGTLKCMMLGQASNKNRYVESYVPLSLLGVIINWVLICFAYLVRIVSCQSKAKSTSQIR